MTPHRLLHDALSKEDYAKVMRNFDKHFDPIVSTAFYHSTTAAEALVTSFSWLNSPEGNTHWSTIYQALTDAG